MGLIRGALAGLVTRRVEIIFAVASALAIVAAVWSGVGALRDAGRDVERAQAATHVERHEKRAAEAAQKATEVTAAETARHDDVQLRIERHTETIIREVKTNVAASTPIPADLARSWVAGLERMCGDAGPGACAERPGDGKAPARADGRAGPPHREP